MWGGEGEGGGMCEGVHVGGGARGIATTAMM